MTMGDAFGPGERRPQLRGVSGWLLFLCIILMVLLPLRLALFAWVIFTSTDWATLTSSEGAIFAVLTSIVLLAFPLLGIVGGVLLYQEKRLGLRLVQVFFGLQVLGSGLGVLAGAIGALFFVIPAAAWLAYLFRSGRVRNTYFENDNPKRASEVFR